jgi:TPR repeat protein
LWLTKLFGGRDVASREEAKQVFLRENDSRALSFAGAVVSDFDYIRRPADLGDAFAQAAMAWETAGKECFRWAEKSAAQGERDGFYQLGRCYGDGTACEKDAERAKENFLVAAEFGHFYGMVCLGRLLDEDDPQRFVWFGRAAASEMSDPFLIKMVDQIYNFNNGIGHANVVFAIGRALKGHVDSDRRAIFGNIQNFDARIGTANQALHFYEFQLELYRKQLIGGQLLD